VKKLDDLARKDRGMTVVVQASGPACQNRSGIIDYGEGQKVTNHNSGIAVIENWLIGAASFPEYSRKNLKVQSESPARSESRLE
jgi:hypothetical protein